MSGRVSRKVWHTTRGADVARAQDARDWAQEHLRGIADSLITPFNGPDGDEIDDDSLRALVRYCLVDLDHDGLWLVSGLAEWWALTTEERKHVAEVTVEEARRVKPSAFLQVCTVAMSAKETVELTRHAQDIGADIVYLQNPVMEVHGGPGMLDFFKYVADRTDIALGMFNSPSSGYELTPAEVARVAEEIPAMCAIKDVGSSPGHGTAVSRMVPGKLVMWDVGQNASALYNAGYLQAGLQGPCMLGCMAYLTETPSDKRFTNWFNLVLEGKLEEAIRYYFSANVDGPGAHGLTYTQNLTERPGYWTHWGSAFKYCAQLVGLPVGDHPYSRPPQLRLTDEQKARIKDAYVTSGLIEA
jgi:4-hydroxy-tetrahydrodipicolinate synthase